jgi:hypothetical protein
LEPTTILEWLGQEAQILKALQFTYMQELEKVKIEEVFLTNAMNHANTENESTSNI